MYSLYLHVLGHQHEHSGDYSLSHHISTYCKAQPNCCYVWNVESGTLPYAKSIISGAAWVIEVISMFLQLTDLSTENCTTGIEVHR